MDDPDCEVEDVYHLLKTDPILSGRLITLAIALCLDRIEMRLETWKMR